MLERVKNQPQKTTGDILDNAIAWKIPIYPLHRFVSWLEKVGKKVEKLAGDTGLLVGRGVRELRGCFLKIETTSRPEFRQFSSWPSLGLTNHKTNQLNGNDLQRMTRKVNRTAKEATSAPGGGNGYCEMCRVCYDQLDTHVLSAQHSKLANDSSQYAQLDSIIAQHNLGVGALRKSLRIAKSPPPYLPPEMGGRQSTESACKQSSPVLSSPISIPKLNGHITRSTSRIHMVVPRVNLGTPVSLPPHFNGIELRSKKTPLKDTKTPTSGSDHEEKTKVKKPCSSPVPVAASPNKHSSASSPSVEHNLRSRKCQVKQSSPAAENPVRSPGTKPLPVLRAIPIVPKSLAKAPAKSSRTSNVNKLSSPPPPPPPQSQSPSKRLIKKRLSVEEKLIEDNKSYYKVEVLNSKLRSTDYFISQKQVEAKLNGNSTSNNNNQLKSPNEVKSVVVRFKKVRKSELAVLSDEAESFMFGEPKKELEQHSLSDERDEESEQDASESEEDVKTTKKSSRRSERSHSSSKSEETRIKEEEFDLTKVKQEVEDSSFHEKVMFSFEMKPRQEIWMTTYQRQAEGNEHYIPQYHTYPGSVMLPYELPWAKRKYKKSFKSFESKIPQHLLHEKPRKSPRCHASTLAIMSSLIPRRRLQRECTDRPVSYEEESSLTETVESSTSASSIAPRLQPEVVTSATKDLVDIDKIDTDPATFLGVDPTCVQEAEPLIRKAGFDLSLEALLSSSLQGPSFEIEESHPPNHKLFSNLRYVNIDSCASSECSDFFGFLDDGRVVSKKRKRKKRNMTGWPNESKYKRKLKEKDGPSSSSSMFTMTDPSFPFATGQHGTIPSSSLILPRKRGRPPKNRFKLVTPTLLSSPHTASATSPRTQELERKSEEEPRLKRKLFRIFTNSVN
ncbi:uncharacterized protein LOC106662249 isoform X2 [Cimex lectularius]|nr:uncharacterized protein LOC106662249 isoform X2 [Cimex lectularius]